MGPEPMDRTGCRGQKAMLSRCPKDPTQAATWQAQGPSFTPSACRPARALSCKGFGTRRICWLLNPEEPQILSREYLDISTVTITQL